MTANQFKILTLNMHKGLPLTRHKNVLPYLRKNIFESQADIVCLQEVVGASKKLKHTSQYEVLADQIWPHYAYGKNAIHSNGHHGNVILSQYPFLQFKNSDVSNHRFERRGVLHGLVNTSKKFKHDLHVMTLHFDLMSWGRQRQVEKLCKLIELSVPDKAPLIICGDFNDWREEISETLQNKVGLNEAHMQLKGAHARTFPTFVPLLKLDRIYFRNLNIEKVERLDTASWHRLSDHLPLSAVFSF